MFGINDQPNFMALLEVESVKKLDTKRIHVQKDVKNVKV
jgi:hypothetical protein